MPQVSSFGNVATTWKATSLIASKKRCHENTWCKIDLNKTYCADNGVFWMGRGFIVDGYKKKIHMRSSSPSLA